MVYVISDDGKETIAQQVERANKGRVPDNFFNPWRPITTAPLNKFVEVCGGSGYRTFSHFLAVAMKDDKYKDAWIDVQHDRLIDCGWEPTHWRHLSEFPPLED